MTDVVSCQATLIAALDAGNADAILAATEALAASLERLKSDGAILDREAAMLALKQSEAAQFRVRYLTAWNRQKIDSLSAIRGQAPTTAYAKPPISALNRR
jgi:alpha-D-ribose 1-methylphosphonate 5-triphosphate synthase subunit PhnI